jgi:predicted ATPase
VFLRQVKIENVRSLRDLTVSFEAETGSIRKWTLLLGENGAGKSSVLRAIALALGGSDALPELLIDNEMWIRRGANIASIQLELVTANKEQRQVTLQLRRGESLAQTFLRNRASLELLDAALAYSPRNYFTIGYGVSRRLPAAGLSVSTVSKGNGFRHLRAQSVASLFSAEANLQSVEQWAMDLDYRRPRAARSILRSAFAEMLPGHSFERIDKKKRQLLFSTPDGALPLSALSDGYQNIIAWCGDLLYRVTETFADYKNPFSARGLLLIDEVDLHLHPVWQRKLLDFLQNTLPNFQILATTHSPLTAHQAAENELYLLRRPSASQPPVLEPFLGDPRKLLLHQFLLSPAFGLETADSRHVELLKTEYSELTAQKKTSSRLDEVKAELADAPEWTFDSPQARKRQELLSEIRRELGKRK